MPVSKEILGIALKRMATDEAENLRMWEAARADADGNVDPDATGRALCANLIHIVRVAEEFAESGPISQDDLVSEGCILFVTAYIPKYDPGRGSSLKNFISAALRRDFVKIVSRDGNPGLAMPMGRLTRIAKKRKEGDTEGADALRRAGSVVSADAATDTEPSVIQSPSDEIERRETLYRLRLAMSLVTERERDVIRARFALPPFDGQETFKDIGLRWGISKERVRQIEAEALRQLRETLRTLE